MLEDSPDGQKLSDEATAVSVIVPTFNRRERLKRLLCRLREVYRSSPCFEVVVAVDGSIDGTMAMLTELRTAGGVPYPLRVLEQPNRGAAAARNRALEQARGEIVLFLDDDVIPELDLVERHLDVLRKDSDAVVIGPMCAPPDQTMAPWLRWEAETLAKQYEAMLAGRYPPTPRQFYTGNASLRRCHVLAAGGFNEQFGRAEDVEFAYRLQERGLRFYFAPSARVLHEPDRSFTQWMAVGYQYGRYDVAMASDRGRDFVLEGAYREWRERHRLSRAVTRVCVGHAWRTGAVVATASLLLGPGWRFMGRSQHALCSALFNLQYWRGIADATGLGRRVWR